MQTSTLDHLKYASTVALSQYITKKLSQKFSKSFSKGGKGKVIDVTEE
jgi:protein involved in sex pheromone biosynthesis